MTMFKIGHVVINVDRINGIQDFPAGDPAAKEQHAFTRVIFDHAHIDLTGDDANTFRRWYRHAARDLAPHRDEEGEDLISPEDQLRKAAGYLLALVDRSRPRDPAVRSAARQLAGMVDRFITGELEPMRSRQFHHNYPEPPSGDLEHSEALP